MKNLLNVFSLLVSLLTGLSSAYCQTDSANLEDLSLKELLDVKVTTASKTSQDLGIAPATVIVISKEQIKMRGYQSLLDVMYDLPEVKVDDKIYSGIRNSFTVRGTQGSEKLIILLDGIIISSPSGEAMPVMENYPVNLAEQIEVAYGPASALYGADAVSGVINIITKKATSKKSLYAEASSARGNTYTNTTLLISKKISDRVNFVISAQYSYDKQPDYSKLFPGDSLLNINSYSTGVFNTVYGPASPVAHVTPRYEAPTTAYNIYGILHVDNFSFSFFRNYSKVPTAYGNNTSNAIYNKEVFMAQSVNVGSAIYKKSFEKIISTTSLTASEYNLDPRSNYRNLYTAMEPGYKYSSCSMVKAEQQLDYKASAKLGITAGATYQSYYSIPQSADLKAPVSKDDFVHGSYLGTESYYRPGGLPAQFYLIRYHNMGSYLQMQYSPNQKMHLTLGARYDMNSRYGSTFNPRLGIVYKPFSKTTFKFLYGSAFIAPNPADTYAQYGSFDTPDSGRTYHSYFLHLPNPGLKPIKSKNAEINVRQYLSDNFSFTVAAYYTILTGLHESADDNTSTHLYNNRFLDFPVDYVDVFINEGKQENYGGNIQLNLKHAIGSFQFNSYAMLSYVHGMQENPLTDGLSDHHDYETEFISPFMFRLGTDIKVGKFTCSPRLLIIGKQNISGIRDTTGYVYKRQTIPGYSLLNISLRYAVTKKISFYANVMNALNQHYKSVGYNMDLDNKNTDLFYGQRQDPIRIIGGFNITL